MDGAEFGDLLNAGTLGFRDGCDGKKPSRTPHAVDIPLEREKAAG